MKEDTGVVLFLGHSEQPLLSEVRGVVTHPWQEEMGGGVEVGQRRGAKWGGLLGCC